MKGNRSKTGFQFQGKLAMSRSPRPAAAWRRCRVINTHRAQRSFGDGLIAEEVKDLHEPWMKHADQVLSDRQIVAAIHEALAKRHPHRRTRGRPAVPAEIVLRLLVLKHMRNWSYGVLL